MTDSITVTVDATWRLARVEFNTPYNVPGTVFGQGEVLLQETATPSPGAAMLHVRKPTPLGDAEEPTKTYGTMRGAMITRNVDDVLQDTVTVDGADVSFETVMSTLEMFFQKWRVEDENAPPPTMPDPSIVAPRVRVPGVPVTPMPAPPKAGPQDSTLPEPPPA
jgi:hypothetical protein